jgi:hypothetical protein
MKTKKNPKGRKQRIPRPPRNGGKSTMVNRMATPWATRYVTQLHYTDEFDISLTSGALNNYVFNANGLFDVDQTGTGHQFLGFDQLAVLYSRYRVLKVNFNVVFGNVATNGAAVRCQVAHVNGSTIPARPAIFEVAFAKRGVVGPYGQPLKLVGSFDLTKLNADPAKYRIDDRYAATVTTNPAEVMYMILSLYPNVTSTCRVCVSFTYHVEFYDPETPGSSITEGTTVEAAKKRFKADQLARQQSLTS